MLRHQRLLARKGKKLPHQAGRAVCILPDLDQIGIVRTIAVLPQQQKVAMAGNRRQKIVEIMGNTPSKLADCLHFLALRELRFQRLLRRRIVENRQNHGLPVFDNPAQRNLHECFGLRVAQLQNLCSAGDAVGNHVADPVGQRPSQPFQNIGQTQPCRIRHLQQIAGGKICRVQAAISRNKGQRDR